MKNHFLLFLLLTLGITNSAICQLYRPANKTKFILTDKDKKNYVLTIDQKKITKTRDTIVFWGKKHYRYVTMSVRLSNLSNTTLEYINMDCSTYDVFTSTNKNIAIGQWPCEHNMPSFFEIGAQKSYTYEFEIFFPKTLYHAKLKFGMYLCKYSNIYDTETFDYDIVNNKWQQSCLIWSNELTIPQP